MTEHNNKMTEASDNPPAYEDLDLHSQGRIPAGSLTIADDSPNNSSIQQTNSMAGESNPESMDNPTAGNPWESLIECEIFWGSLSKTAKYLPLIPRRKDEDDAFVNSLVEQINKAIQTSTVLTHDTAKVPFNTLNVLSGGSYFQKLMDKAVKSNTEKDKQLLIREMYDVARQYENAVAESRSDPGSQIVTQLECLADRLTVRLKNPLRDAISIKDAFDAWTHRVEYLISNLPDHVKDENDAYKRFKTGHNMLTRIANSDTISALSNVQESELLKWAKCFIPA